MLKKIATFLAALLLSTSALGQSPNHSVPIGTGGAGYRSASGSATDQVLTWNPGSDPTFKSITSPLDTICTTTNAMLYRSSGGWACFGPGTSGGVLFYGASGLPGSSALLAANQLVLGGGAGTAPATLGTLGTTTTVLHGNAAGAPTFGAVSLTADVSGILPMANGGTGQNLTAPAGTVLAALTANTITATAAPVLGASGTAGRVTFGNATSGLLTLQPVTGALGTNTLSLPAATDQLVGRATTDTLTNKTISGASLLSSTIGITNLITMTDDRFTLEDNVDNTKLGVFELSGISAGTTRTLTWPNASGTMAVSATAPLALSATTGAMSVTGAAGTVLAGATPAFTATPTLGVAGATKGTLAFAGNTSGTVTIQPKAAAGTWTMTLPDSAGSNTNVLTTDGTGITSWAAAGAGTVTSVATTGGVTGGTITTTGTLSVDATYLPGFIGGLVLSNDGSDATNDIDIAVGAAAADSSSSVNTVMIKLTSALIKRTDANWTVGTNQGCLDTGAVGNNTYHFFVIRRSDTAVVDVLCSLSATAPTMPASYDSFRRIGSIVRTGGAIKAFIQTGNKFLWTAGQVTDVNNATPGTSANTATLTVPTGIVVEWIGAVFGVGDATDGQDVVVTSLAQTDVAAAGNSQFGIFVTSAGANPAQAASMIVGVFTNTSAQARYRARSNHTVQMRTFGWIDTRGQ